MTATEASGAARPQVRLLLSAVFFSYLAQTTLNPILAPLSREVGLAEWQLGVVVATAAAMWVVGSQFWGRRSQSWGRKPVLVGAFAVSAATTALFAVVAQLGMNGIVTGVLLFVLFLVLRGAFFGWANAAVSPTAQAYIADVTTDPVARVKGMAGVGAAQATATVTGSVLGGLLAVAGLIVPIVAAPVLLATGLVLIAVRLRRETPRELIARPARVSPFDPRIWPFLVAGFGMFTALGFVQIITGFLVQDRLGLDAQATGFVTGVALLASGAGMALSQAVIVPRSRWKPPMLLRVGSITALAGFLVLIPDAGLAPLIVAILLVGLGLGIAVPGYTAGPSLVVRREEFGGLAGLLGATNGLTFVVAPILSTVLYGVWPSLPVVIGAAIIAGVAAFVLLHPYFRGPRPD